MRGVDVARVEAQRAGRPGASCDVHKCTSGSGDTTPWMEEVELRLEQRPRLPDAPTHGTRTSMCLVTRDCAGCRGFRRRDAPRVAPLSGYHQGSTGDRGATARRPELAPQTGNATWHPRLRQRH